jgi:alkylation response protein AidB-like acyl-CoA dehydrogenase
MADKTPPLSPVSDLATLQARIQTIAEEWSQQRRERQKRRHLDPADFDRLREAGYLLVGVPSEMGGLWVSSVESTRPVCELLRTLAHGDASVALVSAMHPAVLRARIEAREAPEPNRDAWAEQRRWIFQSVLDGAFWGTIQSEPGSGGDSRHPRAVARPLADGRYLLTGEKHFGSGSGVASFMITNAMPEGEASPASFFVEMRGVPWDGSTGVKLVAEWDGHGMAATQSHAFHFSDCPVTRFLNPENERDSFFRCACAAVTTGIVEVALDTAREQVQRRGDSLRLFETVEWSNAEVEGWLVGAAYEAMLRAAESGEAGSRADVLRGKLAIAKLAESVLTRICRVIGGGTYGRSSPFGFWFEDVRALGFLRPPWGLAYDRLGTD